MASFEKDENKEAEETSSRGVDWEVVSLTASNYGNSVEEIPISGETSQHTKSNAELFMSGHFVFPPSAHENLPLQLDSNLEEKGDESDKDVKNSSIDEATDKEEDVLSSQGAKFDNLVQTGEEDDSDSKKSDDESVREEESDDRGSRFLSESWWRNQAAALYAHAKETGAFWSLCAAAALVGIVILGRKFHQGKWKSLQYDSRFGFGDQRASRIVGPVKSLKATIASGAH